jgi:hypothetical protein
VELFGDVFGRLPQPLVVRDATGAAAAVLREHADLLDPRPELAAEKAAAQLGDPPAEAGDRGAEGGAVTVAAAAAVELELVAVVRADVGVVARERHRFGHFRPFPHPFNMPARTPFRARRCTRPDRSSRYVPGTGER